MTKFIATLATNLAYNDIKIFFSSLSLLYKDDYPTVYLYTDDALPGIEYNGKLVRKSALNKYSSYTRPQMERMPSLKYSSLWFEFQAEKLNLLDWVFEFEQDARKEGVFYFDADICFLGPLPIVPTTAKVGLSPHMIKDSDEARFGKYNAGYIWMKDPDVVAAWRNACPTSRFFEQAALECFDSDVWVHHVHMFPVQHNYGWWRLWQGKKSAPELLNDWYMEKIDGCSGLMIQDSPLCSVHTHFHEKRDRATCEFNTMIIKRLEILAPFHKHADLILPIIS